ncbi:MAG: T9SS type A sorting domain-containing protein [Saprospiraceae bacterium]|nr:T9SS type A sorting domain-containing protein [Candidatus Opimibacter skivensis]MBL0008258.1 T9SS type A sorting domain-containing protein [Candidatus Opimibacter skivensis]MBP9744664.1 T9SS type A sorting domain-containing protein [Saprospiraceae bacterium]
MKHLYIFLITISFAFSGFTQTGFIYSPIEAKNNIILDVYMLEDTVLALQISIDALKSSELLILDLNGNLISRSEIVDTLFNAMRFLKVIGSDVYMLGRFITDSCKSTIATVKYNLQSEELIVLSEVPFCDKNVQHLKIADKLDSGWFVNGYWVYQGYQTFLLDMDTSFNLTLFMDSLGHQQVSIDFSRKGYVLKTEKLCNFYDRDFNYRKQRYNFEEGRFSLHQTHIPFGENYILESYGASPDFQNTGHYVRLIDSAFHIKKEIYVVPAEPNTTGSSEHPFFGGIDFVHESNIWLVGNNNLSANFSIPTHFSVSKISDQLEIKCNQYIGFDAPYIMYGLRATDDGGVIAYGMKYNDSYDPYIIKIGPNCELPTVSTNGPDQPIISISAYPNPGTNELSFTIQGFDPASLSMELIDVTGKILFTAHDLSNRVEVADMPAGQYFYRILQGDRLLGVGAWVKL